ncbi:MAG: hypothetical protein IPI90_04915 [Saprospiraceae bacterium]|nr:hypothetical protein [Candidatus Vicinibacter affinis]
MLVTILAIIFFSTSEFRDTQAPSFTGSLDTLTLEGCTVSSAPAPKTTVAQLEALPGNLMIFDSCTVDAQLIVMSVDSVYGSCPINIKRKYTITDACGNTSNIIVHFIRVDDTTPPMVTGSLDTLVVNGCSAGAAPAPKTTVAQLEALPGNLMITDACTVDASLTVSSFDEGDGTCPIVITRTYNITDACGNTSVDIIHIIEVQDTTKPTFSKPADITIYVDETCMYDADTSITGTVSDEMDNCSVGLDAMYADSTVVGSCQGETKIYRKWTLLDDCNNAATPKTQLITVSDTIQPTFTVPADITIYKSPDIPDTAVIVNYDFNGGSDYDALCPQVFTGISVKVDASSNPFKQVPGTNSGTFAYTNNPDAGNGLTVDSSQTAGHWQFNIKGETLQNCSNIGVHVQGYKAGAGSADVLRMEYSLNGTSWNVFRTKTLTTGMWVQDTATIPGVNSPDSLFLRISYTTPGVGSPKSLHIDNLQVRAQLCCGYDASPNVTGNVTDESDNCATGLLATFCDSVVVEPCEGSNLIYRMWSLQDSCGNDAEMGTQLITVLDTTKPTFDIPNDTTLYKGGVSADTNIIVNYNFNRGNSYPKLYPRLYFGILSEVDSSSNVFLTDTGTITGPLAFAVDSFVGKAMRVDTSDRPGHWQFNLSGFYLPLCSNIKVYSQALMKGAGAADTCHFDYSLNDTTWFRYNSFPLTLGQWKEDTATVPVNGVSKLYLRVTYSGGTGIGDKSFLMDNFQVNAQMNFDSCSYDADPSITGWPTNVMDNCDKHPVVFYVDTIQEGPTCSSETLIFRSWTVIDDCENMDTATQIITILDTLKPIITCPIDVTVNCEQSTDPDSTGYATAFEFCYDTMVLVTHLDSILPGTCPGDYTILREWTAMDSCGNTSVCTQVITVVPIAGPELTCPNDTTLIACQTQGAVNAAFDAWLETVQVSGGCYTELTDDNSGPPDACGGSKTVTFTATSDCEDDQVCMATFTVTAAPVVVLTCPTNATEAACQTQAAIDAKFNTWLGTAMFTGGCNATISNNNNGAPMACGGSKTVTFTVTSTCEPNKTCMATFTVTAAPAVVLTCPVNATEAACQTQAAIDAKFTTWLGTAMFTGGCNGVLTNDNTGAPMACGGTKTVIFTVNSDCEGPKTCSATFTVTAAPAVMLTCPTNATEAACQTQAEIDTKFNTWLGTAMFTGGCNGMLSNDNTGAPMACGGTKTVVFTVTSSCESNNTCSATFTVDPAPPVMLTCPTNATEAACQTQTEINTKFNTWLGTVSYSGGCNSMLSNDNSGAPDKCGGVATVTFTVSSSCESNNTCTATFTVTPAPVVMLTCPANQTEAACQSQADINTKFNTWLGTASFSGGCNATLSNNNSGAPDKCGGVANVTFTVTSTCEPNNTCTASFTVTPAPAVVLTCPTNQTEAECQTQAAIDTKFNTWLGTAMFTKTVTFTVTSDCEGPKTCMATFTVTAAPAVVLTCPTNQTEAECQTQAAIDTKFNTWLGTAMFTGGCNGVLTNDNTGAPMACGGSKTVTFTVTSDCEGPKTCMATFTVTAAPAVVLTCPTNQTEAECQTQAAIDAKFTTWLGTAMFTGGCNGVLTNDNTGAPMACGGSKTVVFTVNSDCEGPKTCSATFTVTTAPIVVITCPTNQTEAACQTQAAIDAKFNTWLGTAMFTGGCNGVLTNDNTGAPMACGGVKMVTFTVTSDCEPNKTCTATFTVTDAPVVVLNCPTNQTEAACQTQAAIDAKFTTWLGTANFSGGCNAMMSNNSTMAPDHCGGVASVTFTVTSDCEPNKTCTATFTVTPAPVVNLTCPVNATEAACQTQAAIDAKFNTWLGTAMFTGGCNGMMSNNSTTAPNACGGSASVTFTVTSDCEPNVTCTATFTVTPAPVVMLTCPANVTEAACQTQAQIDTKFNTWLGTASFSGGCNAMMSNNSTMAPDHCGGVASVTFTVTSDCEPNVTCTATFTVDPAPPVMLTCPANTTEAACQTQAEIDTKFNAWLGTAMFTGGCNGMLSNDNSGPAPDHCGGNKSVTFTVTSDCEPNQTCTATFTVSPAPAVVLTCPTNATEAACQSQSAIDAKFNTWLGTAMFTGGCNGMMSNNSTTAPNACGGSASITFTVTSDCEPNRTCTATFTVTPAPVVMLTCPTNATEAACQSQSAIDAKFNTWLGTAMFTGGCNGMMSNNSTTAPNACGGSASITFTVTSDCEPNVTCTATFTVDPAPPVMLTCPTNATEAACQTQAQIDTKFNTWLGTAMFTGGCNGMMSNNSTTAPNACGGSASITFTVTSDCEPNVTCTATFTVDPAPPVNLTCPANVTEAACQTQAQIDAKFNTWLGTAMFTGGCNGMMSNNSTTAPDHCGGVATVTYTVTSDCEPNVTCTATFTVDPAPPVMLTCPANVTEAACQTQAQIDTKFNAWLGTASFSGGCNAMLSNNNSGPAPDHCGGSKSVTYTVTSDCEPNVTCTATFTVDPAPPVMLTCPANVTEAACQTQAQIDTKFNAWLGTAMFTGGCNGMLSNNNSGPAPDHCGGSKSVTYTVTSDCEPNVTCTATFTVDPAPPVMLTCPANATEAACQTQAEIDTKFNAWLGTAMFTGGCNGMLSNDNSGPAPDHCGGNKSVTFTVTSDCEPNQTCTATFTVSPAPAVVLTCPTNATEAACQSQSAIDAKFNTWLGTAMFTGGCNGMMSNNSTTAPNACGGSASITFTVTSDCEPNQTCTATFTVTPAAPVVMLTCPASATEAACQSQSAIDAKFNTWLGTAMFTGGCNGMMSNNSTTAPNACGGSASITFTVTSDCEPNVTCTATFTVTPAPPVNLTCPVSVTEAACQTQAQIDTKFNTWLGTAMFTGGCNGMLSNNSTTAPDHCGGVASVTYTVTSDCEPNVTCTATFTVDPAPPVMLTCPANVTEAACQTQAQIDTKFNTWLGTAMFTGGCNGMMSNNSTTAQIIAGRGIGDVYGYERLRTECDLYGNVYSRSGTTGDVDLSCKCYRSSLSDTSTNRYKIQYLVGHCDVYRRL